MVQSDTLAPPSDEELIKYAGKDIRKMMDNPAPTPEEILGNGILIKGSKACIYARAKAGKSALAIQLGLCCASGVAFLGIPVNYSPKVFYLNFELNEHKMEQRIAGSLEKLNLPSLPTNFKYLTLIGKDVPLLDTVSGAEQTERILQVQRATGFPVELLIWDCRYKTVSKSENQDDVMKAWGRNMGQLIKEFGFTLLVIHHEGKNTQGVGSGSSVFDRDINTSIELRPYLWESALKPSKERMLIIGGNYTDGLDIPVVLDFPIHALGGEEIWKKPLSKKDSAKNAILDILNGGSMEQEALTPKLIEAGHKMSTIFSAFEELEKEGFIISKQDPTKPGRHNIIDSVLPSMDRTNF